MTNYELIKTLQRTRLGGALSHVNLNNRLDKEQVLNTLFSFFPCVECNLHTKETCGGNTKGCKDTLTKWLDSPVDDIPVMEPKRPKKYIDRNGIERDGCPSCDHNEILYAGQKYCSVCGQRIDWGRC